MDNAPLTQAAAAYVFCPASTREGQSLPLPKIREDIPLNTARRDVTSVHFANWKIQPFTTK